MTPDALLRARAAYRAAQAAAYCALTTGGSRGLVERALRRCMAARIALVAVEATRV